MEREREGERERERARYGESEIVGKRDEGRQPGPSGGAETGRQHHTSSASQSCRQAEGKKKRGHLCYQTHTICNHMPPLNCRLHQHFKVLMTRVNDLNILAFWKICRGR